MLMLTKLIFFHLFGDRKIMRVCAETITLNKSTRKQEVQSVFIFGVIAKKGRPLQNRINRKCSLFIQFEIVFDSVRVTTAEWKYLIFLISCVKQYSFFELSVRVSAQFGMKLRCFRWTKLWNSAADRLKISYFPHFVCETIFIFRAKCKSISSIWNEIEMLQMN